MIHMLCLAEKKNILLLQALSPQYYADGFIFNFKFKLLYQFDVEESTSY